MRNNFVGITGRKRAGKDTAADVFDSKGFEIISFAAPIKLMLRSLLQYQGVDDDTIHRMLEGDLKEVPTSYFGGRTPRYAMQKLGTEWGREMMADGLWVDAAINRAHGFDKVAISDVRFPNEVEAIHDAGGMVFRINRPDRPVGEGEDHPSETQIDTLNVDMEITNRAGSAQEFRAYVERGFFSDTQ